jgi:hypothetical protein
VRRNDSSALVLLGASPSRCARRRWWRLAPAARRATWLRMADCGYYCTIMHWAPR